jgi:hypothetical protein
MNVRPDPTTMVSVPNWTDALLIKSKIASYKGRRNDSR